MKHTRDGGLTSKARKIRERNRARSREDQQAWQVYLGSDLGGPVGERHIPIGRRREFYPTVAVAASSESRTDQPELPWHDQDADGREKAICIRPRKNTAGAAGPASRQPHRQAGHQRSSRETGRQPSMKPPTVYGREGTFRWRGFVTGCMIGTAAASFVLMLLTFVFA